MTARKDAPYPPYAALSNEKRENTIEESKHSYLDSLILDNNYSLTATT